MRAVANNSTVVVFLPNGVYFEAEDGDSSPTTGDPSGHDGIEHRHVCVEPDHWSFDVEPYPGALHRYQR